METSKQKEFKTKALRWAKDTNLNERFREKYQNELKLPIPTNFIYEIYEEESDSFEFVARNERGNNYAQYRWIVEETFMEFLEAEYIDEIIEYVRYELERNIEYHKRGMYAKNFGDEEKEWQKGQFDFGKEKLEEFEIELKNTKNTKVIIENYWSTSEYVGFMQWFSTRDYFDADFYILSRNRGYDLIRLFNDDIDFSDFDKDEILDTFELGMSEQELRNKLRKKLDNQ